MEWLSRFPVVIERKPRRSPRAVPVLPLRPIVRSSYLFPVSCLRRSASQILQTYTRAFLPNRQGPLEGGSVNDCFATALTSSSVRPPLSLSRTSLFCSCLGFFSFAATGCCGVEQGALRSLASSDVRRDLWNLRRVRRAAREVLGNTWRGICARRCGERGRTGTSL